MADILAPRGGFESPEILDYFMGGGQGPNPTTMAGLIDTAMTPGSMSPATLGKGFLERTMIERAMREKAGGRGGPPQGNAAMGGRPQGNAVMPPPRMGGGVAGPIPKIGGGSPMPMMPQPRMGGGPVAPGGGPIVGAPGGGGRVAPPPGGGGGGDLSSTQDFWSELIKGKGGMPKGMEKYLEDYFKKSREVLALKAPNYKGKRVADATGQLDRARQAMNNASTRINNPDQRYKQSVMKHLDPTDYTTKESANRYSNPVVIPGAVGNAGGQGGNPGGQPPFKPPPGGGGGGLTPGYRPPNPDQPPRALGGLPPGLSGSPGGPQPTDPPDMSELMY